MPQSQEYKWNWEALIESEKKILDFLAENPKSSRGKIAAGVGLSYWTVRHRLKIMEALGWVKKEVEYYKGRRWRYIYSLARARRTVVTSFMFTYERVKELGREDKYPEVKERHVEVIVTVDKPNIIDLEPEYVLAVFLDYSAWAFSIGTYRGRRAKPDKRYWPARDYWLPRFIEEEQRRIRIRMIHRLPDAKIRVGSTDEMESEFEKGEYFVQIVYTDYEYPNNSFVRERIFKDALHKYKHGKFRDELVGWVIEVDNEEFAWGTPKYFKEKYGGGKLWV